MARGRKAEPAEIKRLKGNPGNRPMPAPVTQPDELADIPAWLTTDDIGTEAAVRISALAVQIWRRLHGDLVKLKLLKATDENAFGRYCRYMAEWIEHTRAIDRDGAWYVTSSEHVGELRRPHPAVKFRKEVEQALKDLGESMGLTPAARQRIFQQLAQAPAPGAAPGQKPDAPAADRPLLPPSAGPVGFLNRLN